MAMHGLNMPLAGLACDLLENDMENVRLNFEKFKSEYYRVAKMVPEWENTFSDAPISELDAALKSGEQSKVMSAMDQIDKVCHDCHIKYMPAAHFKYHWDDFKSISVLDPLINEDVSFKRFKLMINTDMAGIGNDLQQDQKTRSGSGFQI
jgi:hypothetical protein